MLKYLYYGSLSVIVSSVFTWGSVYELYDVLYTGKDALPFDPFSWLMFSIGMLYIWLSLFILTYVTVCYRFMYLSMLASLVLLLCYEVLLWPWMQREWIGLPAYTVSVLLLYGLINVLGGDPRSFSQD